METAFAELPLALFTTLAPLGAGAFVALACAFFTAKFSDEQLAKIDKMTIIPAVVVLVGFVAAFFHLASPLKAAGVFAGVGSSPLSNEILVGSIFVVVMLVYLVLALLGKLSEAARKGFAAVVAVVAVVFAVFCGLAYGMNTIASWNTPWAYVQILGYCLLGGAAFGALCLSGADDLGSVKVPLIVIALVGVVLAVAGLALFVNNATGLSNPLQSGAEMAGQVMVYLVCAIVCMLASAACTIAALSGKKTFALSTAAVVLAVVGIFVGRLVFYSLQLSVGLCAL